MRQGLAGLDPLLALLLIAGGAVCLGATGDYPFPVPDDATLPLIEPGFPPAA